MIPRTNRRFRTFAVVDAYTGKTISVHPTRSKAEAAKTERSHRVRGHEATRGGLA